MCFGASVLLRKASALKRIDVRYGPQNAMYLQRRTFHPNFLILTENQNFKTPY